MPNLPLPSGLPISKSDSCQVCCCLLPDALAVSDSLAAVGPLLSPAAVTCCSAGCCICCVCLLAAGFAGPAAAAGLLAALLFDFALSGTRLVARGFSTLLAPSLSAVHSAKRFPATALLLTSPSGCLFSCKAPHGVVGARAHNQCSRQPAASTNLFFDCCSAIPWLACCVHCEMLLS